ncbi:MAG: ThuA domain-containing protein [Clostridia bacterium]|nr:ThuA domain-containing protein [Clostridia bacterium]
MGKIINVTIWNEFRHEKTVDEVKALYPDGLHAYLKGALECDDVKITLAALDDGPEHGLTDDVLNNTDVLMWWGHMAHHEVNDDIVEKVRERVLMGMGLIVMHSGHYSKVFQRVVGTTGNLLWGANVKEILWNINPTHPIAAGIPSHFKLDAEEIYSEPFQIPEPDETVFLGWYETGFVFRSGCCWRRGFGRVFYFQPGHETVPTYYNPYVQQILKNAIHYVAPAETGYNKINYAPCVGDQFVSDEELDFFKK